MKPRVSLPSTDPEPIPHTRVRTRFHTYTRTRTHRCRNGHKKGERLAPPANTPSRTTTQYRTSAGSTSLPHRWKTITLPPPLYSVWMSRENRGSKGWGPSLLASSTTRTAQYHTIPHYHPTSAPSSAPAPRHCIPPLNWQHQGRHHTA